MSDKQKAWRAELGAVIDNAFITTKLRAECLELIQLIPDPDKRKQAKAWLAYRNRKQSDVVRMVDRLRKVYGDG